MVTKTLTVTEDAYKAIKSLKHENESFSELFKRLGRRSYTLKDIAGALKYNAKDLASFRERVKKEREAANKDFERRVENVRSRLKRTH